MTTEFCRDCINYKVMDDGTELCLYDEKIDIHELKKCPEDEMTADRGAIGYWT